MSFLNKILDWFNPKYESDCNPSTQFNDTDNVVSFNRRSTELSQLKVTELKKLAKQRGLKGYTALRKSELIDLLDQ